jgi:hypothetical protein
MCFRPWRYMEASGQPAFIHHVMLEVLTNVLEEPTASICRVEPIKISFLKFNSMLYSYIQHPGLPSGFHFPTKIV